MGKPVAVLLLIALTAAAAQPERPPKKLWIVSALAMAAATAIDLHSSTGRLEANPMMRSADGTFNARRGVALKLGISGALFGLQAYFARNEPSPQTIRAATAVNFAAAGAFALTAARNYRLPNQ